MNGGGREARPALRTFGLCVAALVLIAAVAWQWRGAFPPVGAPLALGVEFPRGVAGRSEPLITTGEHGNADFLAVRYVDETHAVLFYDVWGMGGPASAPFALRPGERRQLTVEMPTLAHVARYRSHEQRPLRVILDGATLLETQVYFHRRAPADIFFALNPAGGDLVQPQFAGKLFTADGRALAGGPEVLFGFQPRLAWLASMRWLALLATVIVAAGAGFAAARSRSALARIEQFFWGPQPAPVFPVQKPRSTHAVFLITAAACVLVFTAVLTGGTFRLIAPDAFGEQYDWQARSLLQGRLDLPREARTPESFVFQERTYIYFGPTPALLRLPFTLLDVGFGQLTRAFMLAYFAAWLAAVYAILLTVTRLARGSVAWPSRRATILTTVSAGLGSTMLFLASRAYAYHEAILCGAVFALWAGWCVLRWIAAPGRAWWIGALACGVLAVQARPPAGLFALGLLGAAAVALALRAFETRAAGASLWAALHRPLAIAALAAAGIASFNAVSYAKFRSFEGAPLRYHVQYDAARLAVIAGRNFHFANLRHNFDAYAWQPNFTFRPTFPYLVPARRADQEYREARIDLAEPTLAVPYTMPALTLLALGGAAWALARWRASRLPLVLVLTATAPMGLALLTAVAISQRYTGDFCPPLVLAAAFGAVALDLLPAAARRVAWAAVGGFTVAGVLVTLALALHYQGEVVWGVPDDFKQHYQMLRHAFDSALGLARP
ncbi:MAG: hypothetical protein Q8N18_24165 [Opitutaceae bacterium]|nr:hypothetical protein [Opitutaceae bacterium]